MSSALASSTCRPNQARYNGFDSVNDASKINVALRIGKIFSSFHTTVLTMVFPGLFLVTNSKRT